MFPKEDIKISGNTIDGVIKEEIEEFDTYSDHGLSEIKCEFDEEETKIKYDVLENQLTGKNVDLQFSDGEFSKSTQKIEFVNVKFSKKAIKIEANEIQCENTEKNDGINTDLDLSNIKCEFEEEETKIQYGVFENQLHDENFDKSTMDIPELPISVKKIDEHNTQMKKKVYKCETCNKCFTRMGHLSAHMKIHTGEKPYKCETCGKCFIVKGDLNRHERTHKGEKPYKCETCGKCFTVKGNLNKHNRTHKGEKTYKCETCGKCFTEKGNLNKHNRTHTGEKPYECDTCGKCFTEKKYLNIHNRTHTGDKPYKCETCGRCFAAKGNLNSHNRTHTGEKPYKCEANPF